MRPIRRRARSAQAAASSHSHLAPTLNRIPFCSTTAGVWLTANIIKLCGLPLSLSLCVVELKAYSSVAVSNYLLRASVHCTGTFPFHYSTQAAPIESQAAAAAAAAQQTVSSVHRGQGGRGPSELQWIPRFLGRKDSRLYKPQVQWVFWTTSQEKLLPLSYVCHNYPVSQFSPGLIKR